MLDRCPLCPGEYPPVAPDGPLSSSILFVGEKPGKDENSRGTPFVGKTGQEVNEHYLPLAGLHRPNIRVDNAIKCWGGPGIRDKFDWKRQCDREKLESCTSYHLYEAIDKQKPELIVPMGAVACKAIDPTIDLDLQHGIPIQTAWGTVFPMYHPAGGMHEPKKMLQIRTDYVRLRQYLRGHLYIPVDPYAGREDYRCLETPLQVRKVLRGNTATTLACDTEVMRHNRQAPFCLSLSVQPGTGYVIMAGAHECLSELQHFLDRWEAPILWHNWLFDCEVIRAMDLRFPRKLIVDTMVKAFHLGNLPQGLKALAYRELGMKMTDFDDVVTPYSTTLCLEYLSRAMYEEWPKPKPQMVRQDDGGFKEYKPQSFRQKLKRFFGDYQKSPDTVDVFERWKNWEDAKKGTIGTHALVEEVMQEKWPGKCISHVPFQKALHYACRDSDALIRLWPVLKNMQRQVRRKPQELWREIV